MCHLMAALHEAGWSRYGWPTEVGGAGGTIAHRGVLWEALARHGVTGMALFEHLEILAPALAALGPPPFVAEALPAFLAGRELWAQGFSEPDAGSDLASLRTTAVRDGDEYVINGRKIWTSWARYARWCLLLARTGTKDSRHRGLTALIVDLRSPGVEVSAIEQANGTDELAEVAFDGVRVPADRIVGELDGGWAVAMHILSHERGTFAWFRHCFEYQKLLDCAAHADGHDDSSLGSALLDLAAVTATGHAGLLSHASGRDARPEGGLHQAAAVRGRAVGAGLRARRRPRPRRRPPGRRGRARCVRSTCSPASSPSTGAPSRCSSTPSPSRSCGCRET